MLGSLSKEQIEYVLQAQLVGRIGCCSGGKVYIVPITYAYHNNYIYAQSREGLKVHMMRQNPSVCFETDQMENHANWRSVIIWGTYEELRYPPEQEEARRILHNRLTPYITSETVSPAHHNEWPPKPELVEKPMKPVVFRIKITESSGRYEKSDQNHPV